MDNSLFTYSSKHLNSIQLRSLERVGDLYIPGTNSMPSFAESGCLEYVDTVVDEVDPDDVFLMGILLLVLRLCPVFIIDFLLTLMDRHDRFPDLIAGPLRLMSLALKGVVMSLYYSGLRGGGSQAQSVHEAMGYALHCEPDLPQEAMSATESAAESDYSSKTKDEKVAE